MRSRRKTSCDGHLANKNSEIEKDEKPKKKMNIERESGKRKSIKDPNKIRPRQKTLKILNDLA